MKKAVLFLGLLMSSYYIAQETKNPVEEKLDKLQKKIDDQVKILKNSEKVLPPGCQDKQVLQLLRKNINEAAVLFSQESGREMAKYYPYTRYEVTNYSIHDPKVKTMEDNGRLCEATIINHSIPQIKGKFMYIVGKTKKGLVVAIPIDAIFLFMLGLGGVR